VGARRKWEPLITSMLERGSHGRRIKDLIFPSRQMEKRTAENDITAVPIGYGTIQLEISHELLWDITIL
jgi:hypothetical protein